MPAESKSVPERIVDALYKLAGSHPGARPVHAKGLVCRGTFRASAEAHRLSRAELFRGQPVPATIRFANANGDPNVHDGQPNVRSMAVKIEIAGGKPADILANTVEGFIARTPEEFLAFLEAQLPDPATGKPSPDAVPRFLESHPASKAFIGRLMARPIPASYGLATYHAGNALRFTAADGSSRFGRYHWVPEAGESFLSPEVGAQRGPNFLREELAERLARGPVAFRLTLQLAAAGDPTDDPTAALAVRPPRGRAGSTGDRRHLADERSGRATPDLRSRQCPRRHRAVGRPDPPGAVPCLCRVLWPAPRRNLRASAAHRGDDVREQLRAEVRCDLHRLDVGLHVVEVLQAEHVVAIQLGDDPGEEEAQRLERRAREARSGIRQWQVEADPVDPTQTQLAQPEADELGQIAAIGRDAERGLAPGGKDLDAPPGPRRPARPRRRRRLPSAGDRRARRCARPSPGGEPADGRFAAAHRPS